MKKIFLLLLFLASFSALFYSGFILSQYEEAPVVCPGPPPNPSWSSTRSWDEYKCQNNNCGGNRLIRNVSQNYGVSCSLSTTSGGDCPSYSWSCQSWEDQPVYGPERLLDTAPAYAACQTGENWSRTKPSFACDGKCLETPKNPKPKDKTEKLSLPNNFLEDGDFLNKVGWNSVLGFKEQLGPKSYKIRVENTNYENVVTENKAVIPACTFQSNAINNWGVKACCSIDGQNCGASSNWSFQTTLPPELKFPPDSDWEGKKEAITSKFPLYFEWCPVPGAKSYYITFYKNGSGKIFSDWPVDKKPDGILYSDFTEEFGVLTTDTSYDWQVAACLKEFGSKCGLNCEDKQWGGDCADLSQKWQVASVGSLEKPELIEPRNGKAVNMLDQLEWTGARGAYSYRIYIEDPQEGWKLHTPVKEAKQYMAVPMSFFWGKFLKLDRTYNWWVLPCWDTEGILENCEDKSASTKEGFKTTGAPPENLKAIVTDPEGKVLIPATFDWDDVPGVASYAYEISGGVLGRTLTTKSESLKIEYPVLQSGEKYQLRVQTCADKEGEICGKWKTISFSTIYLVAPSEPYPINQGELFTRGTLNWKKILGANFYQYEVSYISKDPKEVSPSCQTGKIAPKVVSSNIDITNLVCLGQYQWQARACIDDKCQDASPWSSVWGFSLVPSPGRSAGLVPCLRNNNDPNTSWDEREPCQIKHLFLMVKSVLDLLLWRIGPIILVLLVTATGLMYYFSFGTIELIAKARSMLRAAAIGYVILLFGWLLIFWVLKIFGVTIKWWILTF